MTSNGRDDDDLSAPELDAAARAEHAWLIAREADPAAPPPSAKVAAEYAQLETMLGDLTVEDDDDDWRAEVLRRAHEMSTPRRAWWRRPAARWALIGCGVAAAVVIVLLTLRPPASVELAFRIVHADTRRSDPNEAVVGDQIIAPLPRGGHDLRLFRPDGHLVAYCPGGPGCSAGGVELAVKLDAVGMYYLYLVTDNVEIPFDATMRDFVDRTANAHVQMTSFVVH